MSRRAPNPAAERAAQNTATLKSLVKLEANKVCSDCKKNKHPRWASWNLGVFICIRCSGIHRGMGTHISRVKSVDLDSWTDEQLQSVLRWGNARANKYWEAKLAPGHAPSEAKIENFIRTKYELKRWVMDGPMPDPASLDADGDDDVPLSIVKEKQVIERKESIRKASLGNSQAPHASHAIAAPQEDLIGGDPVPIRSSSAAPHGAKVAPKGEPAPPRTTSTKDSLLGLDFFGEPQAPPRPASTTGTAPSGQSRPDLKQSILSLYASAPRPQAHAQPQQPPSSGGFGGLASPTFSHQSQGSVGGFSDAFSSLSMSNAPKPAAPDPFASLGSSSRNTSSNNAFGGLGGGSFFDSKPSQPAAPTHQHQSSNFSNFGGFASPAPAAPAAAAPKPTQSSAMGDLFDLSAPVTTSPPPQQPAPVSSSVFNLSSPQSPPAVAPTNTTTTTNTTSSIGGFSGADVWGGGSEWGAPAAPSPAPVQRAPEPPKPAANDFGWSNSGGAFANTPIVPGASGGFNPIASPKVSADEEFGGWTSSGPAAGGSSSQAKPSGGFGGDDDLFSNVWS
ncbi:Ff.00g025780.m01.CDS01 [Fusarium sp. VM40]|nr:Ff.00g025780.m01.CDS01 [Fusarium sp. VM40]